MTFDESVPDSIRVALTAAKEAWEAKLPAAQEIYIQATMEPLNDGISMQTFVGYGAVSQFECAPCALISQHIGQSEGSLSTPDGIIVLNQNLLWNCSFSQNKSSGYNAYTAALRGIAISLGFGASVCKDYQNTSRYIFIEGIPSYFDKRIHNGNVYLNTMENGSLEMKDFVTSNTLLVQGKINNYHLYSTNPFVEGVSLVYLNDKTSIMHYAIGEGDKMFTIDTATLDVLNGIGWDFATQQEGAIIKCNDIASDGIGSSYSSHTFSLDNIQTANGHLWKFSLKNKEGIYEEVSNGANATFTIAPVQSTDKYYINTNGDLEGKIECQYSIGNKNYAARPFHVSLELKPSIISIDNMNRIFTDDYYYYVNFIVHYTGAEKITLEVEEEYSTYKLIEEINEPYIAHAHIGQFHKLYYNWITIVVTNKYGTVRHTLDFASEIPTELNDITASLENENAYILNMKGICVTQLLDSDNNKALLPKGMYIRRTIDKNGRIRTQKFIVR